MRKLIDYHNGNFISVASYEDADAWKKAVSEGKAYMVQNRYGYPHKVVYIEEKKVTPTVQKVQ